MAVKKDEAPVVEIAGITTTETLGLSTPADVPTQEQTEGLADMNVDTLSKDVPEDELVLIRPAHTTRPYIGDRYWDLEKGKVVNVPKSVKTYLHTVGALAPL